MLIPTLKESPCARTDHGAFPDIELTSSASPNPKIVNPKIKIATRLGDRSHLPFPVHGVIGIVRCGRRKFVSQDN